MTKKRHISFEDRQAALIACRNLKMAASSHAYMRGNTRKFYDWLESDGRRVLPEGPPIWICGDCHIGNLGPLGNINGRVEVQIRDLDQTVIGNPAHDLIRLGLSLASAARGSDLPGVTTALMLEEIMQGYSTAFARGKPESEAPPAALAQALKASLKRSWKQLARERIEDTRPFIPLGKTFWSLTADESKEIKALFRKEGIRRLVTSLESRDDDAPIKVMDAAYWRKGCSSLGRLRYAVLLRVGDKRDNPDYSLVDIKEAAAPAAPWHKDAKMPRDNGQRVITGASELSPFLGGRMRAEAFLGKSVFLRELMPQDLKTDLEHLSRADATAIARYLANVLGKAHARQLDSATRKSWLSELKRACRGKLDAPSWLWTSVVDLMASHESAYLEHCRRYALEYETVS